MIINTNHICYDLLAIQLGDGTLDISWAVDTDSLKSLLQENDVSKVINFYENVDFIIQIDNVETFDSINLKQYTFSEIEKTYSGNIVFSAVIPFNKNQLEETNYFLRVKLTQTDTSYNIMNGSAQEIATIEFNDTWSDAKSFVVRKNYTKDIIETMYTFVADFNAYNKEAKSANMYYIFQAFADTLDKEYEYVLETKNNHFINKAKPDNLVENFGVLFKFSDISSLNMEEYRRIMHHLIIGYQNGGAWNYIKEALKYLVGYTPDLVTFKNFYPWILRKENNIKPDPTAIADRNYNNPESNYYLYKDNFDKWKNKNEIMLLSDYFENFTFVVKADNFFNIDIDKSKIGSILDLLKSVYTKYLLNISPKVEVSDIDRAILADDNNLLMNNDTQYMQY